MVMERACGGRGDADFVFPIWSFSFCGVFFILVFIFGFFLLLSQSTVNLFRVR